MDDKIVIKSPLKQKIIKYAEISDEFISSGFLAKRFNCGSIYLILNKNTVNIIKDVENPEKIEDEIRTHMSSEE
ncbi:PH domain-containing protein [Acidianus brierleyi]|uniref:PH domain-containing protein n=1 Tax=Acidianus brierleyi TaxID=41673 RepID=UPI001B31163A|nr:PH domain-containing protein [Acidianus brierleyi]